ncbi:MAG: hypothetical protein ACRD6X_11855 [Pyrinomonadaceae bacterium]
MSKFESPLYNIKIASPCSADWQNMFGSERKRFCGDCKLNVYNISGMTLKEAEQLLENSEGRLCVRYYRRADGTILTKDCPVGWAKVRQRVSRVATAAFSLIVGLFSGLFLMSFFSRDAKTGTRFPIPLVNPTPEYYPTMGAVSNSKYEPEMGKVMGNAAIPIKRTKASRN